MSIQSVTKKLKEKIHNLGIELVGIADMSTLNNIPFGLPIAPRNLFEKFPYAIVMGAQYGKLDKHSSGDETALYLEKIAYDVMGYLEKNKKQYLVIHPEDEYDPDERMGLVSLKILAKEAGLGWQGRSLLIISPVYGPIHRLIAILTNMKLKPDKAVTNQCGDCCTCIDKCPTTALKLNRFDDHPKSRKDVLNVRECLGDNDCAVCIKACPFLLKF